ncbi:hypothetical protein EJ06DRAFT_532528 [Trichodelitschia bisporula]|uniref:Uncharacterized protein n=1 Tax=Trichodelitschia bisporula TaxID=703511 RepID=A0A6G1HQ22_9PEZI|nr:hypothetical protein EJ06DRAFT_532528 [Trichodelitschia bisporula]
MEIGDGTRLQQADQAGRPKCEPKFQGKAGRRSSPPWHFEERAGLQAHAVAARCSRRTLAVAENEGALTRPTRIAPLPTSQLAQRVGSMQRTTGITTGAYRKRWLRSVSNSSRGARGRCGRPARGCVGDADGRSNGDSSARWGGFGLGCFGIPTTMRRLVLTSTELSVRVHGWGPVCTADGYAHRHRASSTYKYTRRTAIQFVFGRRRGASRREAENPAVMAQMRRLKDDMWLPMDSEILSIL